VFSDPHQRLFLAYQGEVVPDSRFQSNSLWVEYSQNFQKQPIFF
jgi:hypothetical protein